MSEYAVKRSRDLCFATEKQLCLDLFVPQREEGFPLLIYFHGGGLESGEKGNVSSLGEEFARGGTAFAAPDYSLYPYTAFPEFLEDAAKAVAFSMREIQQYGICTDVFLGGHSAGAYIALMLLFEKKYLAAQNVDVNAFSGAILASGQVFTHNTVLKYRGVDPHKIVVDEAAPLYHLHPLHVPLQIICAQNDLPMRLEQNQLLHVALKELEYPAEIDFQLLMQHDHISYVRRQKVGNRPLWQSAMPFIERHTDRTE